VSREDFQYVEMDTDSAYMALSGDSLDDVVKPEMKVSFYQNYGDWFPKPFCPRHRDDFVACKTRGQEWNMDPCCEAVRKYDLRTPGLFKEEFGGTGIVALNPKTYFCWDDDDGGKYKYSSKGLSKRSNRLTKEAFMGVLTDKTPVRGVNKGFVRKDNTTYTYDQLKTGLTYFYGKHQVCSDGVSTTNIKC
jgi:hypothetical protein